MFLRTHEHDTPIFGLLSVFRARLGWLGLKCGAWHARVCRTHTRAQNSAFLHCPSCCSAHTNTTPRFLGFYRSFGPVWVGCSRILVPGTRVCAVPTRAPKIAHFCTFRRVAPHTQTRHPDFWASIGPSAPSAMAAVEFWCLARACVLYPHARPK